MKIIVPVDFSENSVKALEFALALADKKEGTIILVNAIDILYDFASQASIALDGLYQDAESHMKDLMSRYAGLGVNFDYLIKEGMPSITIARIADEYNAALIVMGTQGSSGIKQVLIGSTTVNTIKESKKPVLVVPYQANVSLVQKAVLALEFANHEEKFIDWIVDMSQRWGLGLEFLHVQSSTGFKEELSLLGLEAYIVKKYASTPVKIHTFYASSASEGLDQFLAENEHIILIMCHEHKNLWQQILSGSTSIRMAYHTQVPLLIMV